jgi:alanine dehydrogenase
MIAEMGLEKAAKASRALKLGINVYKGKCVYDNVAKAFNITNHSIDELLK